MNRIYTCTDFRGHWPVGVSSVVVAADRRQAKQLLDAALKKAGIPLEGDGHYILKEVDIESPAAVILNNGDYL